MHILAGHDSKPRASLVDGRENWLHSLVPRGFETGKSTARPASPGLTSRRGAVADRRGVRDQNAPDTR